MTELRTVPRNSALPPALIAWLQAQLPGHDLAIRQVSGGLSRVAYRVESSAPGGADGWFLLVERDPLRGGNAREAAVMRALQSHGVRVPRVVAFEPATAALLTAAVPGSADITAVESAAQRMALAADLMRELASIHRLAPDALAIAPACLPCPPAASHVAGQLEEMRGLYAALERDGLVDLAMDWLEAWAPSAPARLSLVHGDAGAGNFLFLENTVTGILDWEIAHFGDPMEDLAALAVRHLSTPICDPVALYRAYEAAGGPAVDIERVEYFRVLVLVRNALLIRHALRQAPAEASSGLYLYEAYLLRSAAEALCHQYAVPIRLDAALSRDGAPGANSPAAGPPDLIGVATIANAGEYLRFFLERFQHACLLRAPLLGALIDSHVLPLNRHAE